MIAFFKTKLSRRFAFSKLLHHCNVAKKQEFQPISNVRLHWASRRPCRETLLLRPRVVFIARIGVDRQYKAIFELRQH